MRWVCYTDSDGCSKELRGGDGQLDPVRSAGNTAELLAGEDTRWSAGFGRVAAAAVDAVDELCSRDAVVGGVRVEGPVGGGDDAA